MIFINGVVMTMEKMEGERDEDVVVRDGRITCGDVFNFYLFFFF